MESLRVLLNVSELKYFIVKGPFFLDKLERKIKKKKKKEMVENAESL